MNRRGFFGALALPLAAKVTRSEPVIEVINEPLEFRFRFYGTLMVAAPGLDPPAWLADGRMLVPIDWREVAE